MLKLRHRNLVVASMFAGLAVFTTACGNGGSADDSVATLSNDAKGSGDASQDADNKDVEAPENRDDAMALFEECMEDAGINLQTSKPGDDDGVAVESNDPDDRTDAHDPQAGGSDQTAEAFDEARSTCEGHLANVDGSFDMSPEQKAAFEDAQLEWTECMRKEDVNVPDFDGSGSGSIVVDGTDKGDRDPQSQSVEDLMGESSEEFEAAAKKCDSVYEKYEALDDLGDKNGATK